MKRRPIPLIIVSVVFVIVGVGGLFAAVRPIFHFGTGIPSHELRDTIFVAISGVLAVTSGVFMLRGQNWARWLCLVWLAFHVVMSFFHETLELVVHFIFLVLIALILFKSSAATYFRRHPVSDEL
jgi:hypothetical protein